MATLDQPILLEHCDPDYTTETLDRRVQTERNPSPTRSPPVVSARQRWCSIDTAHMFHISGDRWRRAGLGIGKVLETGCVFVPVHLHLGRRYTQHWRISASMEASVLCRKFTTAWTVAP